ncbi:uncharacterized protein [Montipora foliosa]|uniref:uncharacterized protein isoform X2 n=1 Tax=Montipora foliosa TaxID=591990 RepID=UPI0035F1223F
MVFAVVQWLEEYSVSVINEKQVILDEDLELKEGLTVDVSAGKNSKGRLAVYKATVLKLFGTKAKALEYETSLLTPAADTNGNKDHRNKRARKPSQKVRDNEVTGEQGDCEEPEINEPVKDASRDDKAEQPANKKRKITNKKEESATCNKEDKENELKEKKLQQTVQQQRVQMILGERKTAQNEMITLSDDEDTCTSPHITPPSETHKHTITSQSPSPLHFTPGGNHNTVPDTITSHSPPHFTPGTHTIASQSDASHHMTPATNYPMQHTLPTPTQSLQIDPHEPSLTPLSRPTKHYPKSFTQQLMEEDIDILPLRDQSAKRKLANSEVGRNWESFSAHFTQEFEWLKGEVDGLRSEVKSLRKIIKEMKANASSGQGAEAHHQTPENQLLHMVRNTTKPLEGLKSLLFHLYTPDEVRQSSLKGRTTVAGGETVGLQKENLDLIYCVMEQRYKMERLAVDNLIRGQQRKLRNQQKKLNSS